jgi:hypothetical protein
MAKIVGWDEFTKMPPGTVFWEYEPEIYYNPAVLCKFIEHDGEIRDFSSISLAPWRCLPEDDIEVCGAWGRWGLYNYDQEFCVLDASDINEMISTMNGEIGE